MLTRLVPWFRAIKNRLLSVFRHNRPPATSASSASCASGACVIEFYVPEHFQAPQRRWVAPEVRGKVIEFSGRRTKSA